MMARLAFVFALLASQMAWAQENIRSLEERDTVEISPHPSVKLGTVVIDNRLGDVTVVGHDSPFIKLNVLKRAPEQATLDRLKVNLMLEPKGAVRIDTALMFGDEARPVPVDGARIDIVVMVPRGSKVSVKAWNGILSMRGLRSGLRLSANDAKVFVTDVKGVISTSNARGEQRFARIDGAVVAGNTFGDLLFDDIRGPSLAATVHRGRIEAKRVRSRDVTLRSTFGPIVFQGKLSAGGKYDLRSHKGNVAVKFSTSAAVHIEAFSRSGGIDSQLDVANQGRPSFRQMRAVYGHDRGPAAVLRVSSTSGNVSLGLMNE